MLVIEAGQSSESQWAQGSGLLEQCVLQIETWRDAADSDDIRQLARLVLSDPGAIALPSLLMSSC